MKQWLLTTASVLLLSQSVFADYEIFTGKSEPFSHRQVAKKEVIFFGELESYNKSLEEIRSTMAVHGAMGVINGLSNQSANLAKGLVGEGLKAGATGLGIGLLYGVLDPYIMSFYADQQYAQVYKVTLRNGKTVYMNRFFVGDKHPALSEAEIKSILGGTK